MEGRSAVETWAEFGCLEKSGTPQVRFGFGTNIFISTGSDEVYVFSAEERKLTAVLQFPGSVCDLVGSNDTQLLFVACSGGVYGVNLQLLLHRYQRSSSDASSSPAEVNISSEFLLVGADGVSSLLLVGSLLLTLSQSDTSWLLTLYKHQTQPTSYETLSSFCLPLVSPVVQDDAKLKAGQPKKSVLICVHYDDGTPRSSFPSVETDESFSPVCLDPVLFKLLFGVEAALAKSPVILCGLPDGRLCFLPLRLPGSRLQVLHSLEQPVMFVGASVVMETNPRQSRCLVVVGEQGRVVLIKTDKAGTERGGVVARFTESCVSGPVECGCVDKSCFYYSTGSDLLMLDLSEGSAGREERERDEEALRCPTSLNVCRVIALSEPQCNAAGEVELLGLSVRGQLQSIRLPGKKQDPGLSKLPSAQVGHSVKDLLSAIGDVCERASVLKTVIKSKNQTLRQLNQVVNISFLLTASGKTEEPFLVEEKPIRCHATVKWSRSLQKDSLNLKCVLDNSSPYVLERGWTLSITVCPLSSSEDNSSVNFSFPVYSLCPGETLEVFLPVAAAGDTSFPLTVNCSLIFSLSSFLEEEEVVRSPGLQNSCFTLPLNTLTVDWLHALQVIRPRDTVTLQSNAMDTVQAFLSSRGIRSSRGDSVSKPEKYSVSVRVSSECLRKTLKLKNFIQEPEVASQSLCSSLLDWLLFENQGGMKMGHKGDESVSVVHARAPNDSTVKLTAKQVNVEEENEGMEEEWRVCMEVQIESSSITAVCGLHHAVLRRMQTLLRKTPDEAASTKQVQSLGLRRALRQAQILQTQISEALSVGFSSGPTNRFLLRVYQELRDNPLLIM